MQDSKSITDQLEELIKKARSLKTNEHVSDIYEKENEDKCFCGVTDLHSLELKMLDKRLEMCAIQKNAVKALINTHKDELELLESALRSIVEEEKKIQGVMLRESPKFDIFSKATSMELIEHDNSGAVNHLNSKLAGSIENTDILYSEEGCSVNSYENDFDEKRYSSPDIQTDNSENYNYGKSCYKRSSNSERKVSFSVRESKLIDSEKEKNLNLNPTSNQPSKSRNQIKATISIPRRYNYIRNKNSSLLKNISIKKILDENRRPNPDEKDLEQRELVRQLHSIYGSRK